MHIKPNHCMTKDDTSAFNLMKHLILGVSIEQFSKYAGSGRGSLKGVVKNKTNKKKNATPEFQSN